MKAICSLLSFVFSSSFLVFRSSMG